MLGSQLSYSSRRHRALGRTTSVSNSFVSCHKHWIQVTLASSIQSNTVALKMTYSTLSFLANVWNVVMSWCKTELESIVEDVKWRKCFKKKESSLVHEIKGMIFWLYKAVWKLIELLPEVPEYVKKFVHGD